LTFEGSGCGCVCAANRPQGMSRKSTARLKRLT